MHQMNIQKSILVGLSRTHNLNIISNQDSLKISKFIDELYNDKTHENKK